MSARAFKIVEMGRLQLLYQDSDRGPLHGLPQVTPVGPDQARPMHTLPKVGESMVGLGLGPDLQLDSAPELTDLLSVNEALVSRPSTSGVQTRAKEQTSYKDAFASDDGDFGSDDSVCDRDWVPVNGRDSTSDEEEEERKGEEGRENIIQESEEEVEVPEQIPLVIADQHVEQDDNGQNVDDEVPAVKRGKKRSRDPSKWKRNQKKTAMNSGDAYVNASGKAIAAKTLKPPCDNKCRLKCTTKIAQDQRQLILNSFWGLRDTTRQRDFITKCIATKIPEYRRPKEGSARGCNNQFSFEIADKKIIVCKKFFQSTINVGNTMIDTSLKKKNDQGVVSSELRGKHGAQKKIDGQVKDFILEHINSFPRIESHYCRANTDRQYVEGSLNIATMYRLYCEKCRELGYTIAKMHHYASIFNTEFNISFFTPKKDQCGICAGYENALGEAKDVLKIRFDNHNTEKTLARQEKGIDVQNAAERDDVVVSCYDLQAVLQTPCGEVSALYYKRRLATYNFTVFDLNSKDGYCYVWHEALANRGANEIGSCVREYLINECIGKNVIFYTDNCVGQNKNKYLVTMYIHTVLTKDIQSVTHKFLQVGHTQNEGDNMHSVIEREKKRMLKSGPIYVPSQWVSVIRLSKKTGNPYHVKEMNTDDFVDLKCLTNELGKNFTVNDAGEKVVWADIRVLRVEKCSPFIIFYKTTYSAETYKTINIRLKMRGRPLNLSSVEVKEAYEVPPKVSALKKQDLLSLCKDNLIPSVYHTFYHNLQVERLLTGVNDNNTNSEDEWVG